MHRFNFAQEKSLELRLPAYEAANYLLSKEMGKTDEHAYIRDRAFNFKKIYRTGYEERYASKYALPQAYAYAICLKEDNYPIGYIKVDMEEHHDFGYGLRREFWHRGIVTEAGKTVIEQVKRDGLVYITATHDRNNPRSGGIMQNVGMKYQYSYEEQCTSLIVMEMKGEFIKNIGITLLCIL